MTRITADEAEKILDQNEISAIHLTTGLGTDEVHGLFMTLKSRSGETTHMTIDIEHEKLVFKKY